MLALVAVLSALFGICTHRLASSSFSSLHGSGRGLMARDQWLHGLVARQNATIAALEAELARIRRRPGASECGDRDVERQLDAGYRLDAAAKVSSEASCEQKFGAGLVESYRSSAETWCEGGSSRIVCHRHVYDHNGKVGLFCVGYNVTVDPGKIRNSRHLAQRKARDAYLQFDAGATTVDCRRTAAWDAKALMPHMAQQLRGLQFGTASTTSRREHTTTYLMARDEDCDNYFHSTADHMNAYLVGLAAGLDWRRTRTLLWDRHPDGPFIDLITRAFSGVGPLGRAHDLPGPVVFDRVVFHLESPAGIVFPKVAGPRGIMTCHSSSLWRGYLTHVLRVFRLLDEPPPTLPTILLSVRRRTQQKNVGRVFADEGALVEVLRRGNGIRFEVIDLAATPFADQLAKVRRSNVLVGAHGAGLMHALFLADEAVLLEIHPSYRLDRHFRLAARMAGKIYLPLRSTQPVSCQGSSDSVPVDQAEFERAIDAAVRIARNFAGGVAECGLRCDPRVLALDPAMSAHVPPGTRMLVTRFPCGR